MSELQTTNPNEMIGKILDYTVLRLFKAIACLLVALVLLVIWFLVTLISVKAGSYVLAFMDKFFGWCKFR